MTDQHPVVLDATEVAIEKLNRQDSKLLRELEGQVDRARRTAVQQASQALKEIHRLRLYRATHTSFEAYCFERFDISRSTANRMLNPPPKRDARVLGPRRAKALVDRLGQKPDASPLPDPVGAWDVGVIEGPNAERIQTLLEESGRIAAIAWQKQKSTKELKEQWPRLVDIWAELRYYGVTVARMVRAFTIDGEALTAHPHISRALRDRGVYDPTPHRGPPNPDDPPDPEQENE